MDHLGLSPTADIGIFVRHGDILKIVEVAEDADLGESRYPGDECEPYIFVHRLEVAEEAFQQP